MSNTQLARISDNTVAPLIKAKENDLIQLIGKENMIRETSFAIQAANSNSMLADATPVSVAKAVWNVAISGLSLNPILKFAYLVPKRISGVVEAILMPSYMGICKLITDTGSVKNIYAYPVYKGDIFEVQYGTETKLLHTPKFHTSQHDDITHVYAVAVLLDGSTMFEVMDRAAIDAIRDRSDGWKAFKAGKTSSAIWLTDYGEMSRKTVVKRIAKYLPKSDVKKWERVMEAVNIDNADYPASDNQIVYINSLIETSTFDERQRSFIERQLSSGITSGEAAKMIDDLQMNQLDPVTQGGNYNQGDIKAHQKQLA